MRAKSSVWQQRQREWRASEAQVEWEGSLSHRAPSEPYTWAAEERMSDERGALQEHKPSSGASAVLARRDKAQREPERVHAAARHEACSAGRQRRHT